MNEKKYNIADILLIDAIDNNIKRYGIEGTEDKIKELYTHPNMEKLKNMLLNELYRRYKRN